MSTKFGYLCRTCHEESPHWLNHGDDVLIWLFVHRADILPAWRLSQGIGTPTHESGAGYLEMSVTACYDDPHPLPFLHQHGGHDLVLCSEYGDERPLIRPGDKTPGWKAAPEDEHGC